MNRHKCDLKSRTLAVDGHGIPLGYYCDECEVAFWARWRPDILSKYECDEDIDPEPGVVSDDVMRAIEDADQWHDHTMPPDYDRDVY